MTHFEDSQGGEWSVDITGGSLLHALLTAGDLAALQALCGPDESERLGDVLYVLCTFEREDRGVGREEFDALLDGDTLDLAREALARAAIEAEQDARERLRLRRAWSQAMHGGRGC